MRDCSVPDCPEPHHAKGYCSRHYQRFIYHGDPTAGRVRDGGVLEFLYAVLTTNPTGCPSHGVLDPSIPAWPYAKGGNGYPQVVWEGRRRLVHQLILEWRDGRPIGKVASHLCGNGHLGCISPVDLCWQTRAEDRADAKRHGTATPPPEGVKFAKGYDPRRRRTH